MFSLVYNHFKVKNVVFSYPFMSEPFISTEGVGPVDLTTTSGYSVGDGDPFVHIKAACWRTKPIKLDSTCAKIPSASVL